MKKLLLILDQDTYSYIKETSKKEKCTVLKMIRELIFLGIRSYQRKRK